MEEVLGKGCYWLLMDISKEKSYPSAQEQKEGQDVAQDIGERSNQVSNDISKPEEDSTEQEERERGESMPNKQVMFAKGTMDKTQTSNSSVSKTTVYRTPESTRIPRGRTSETSRSIPRNPYTQNSNPVDGVLVTNSIRVDKSVTLKKGMVRGHIHRYTLRFKTIKAKEEEDGHQIVKNTLQIFLDILLQADPKTIIPPYLELDRSDKTVPDLSNLFTVSSIDSHYALKKYFFHLSPREMKPE